MSSTQDVRSSSPRLYILDPLRFVAALAVMAYHYLPYLVTLGWGGVFSFFQYGYLGVNFFFMLSGFVIMASCEKRSAWQFAMLRAVRIYPAFVACLCITLISLHFFGDGMPPLKNIIANALIVNDYLKIPNVDGVYWTLQAELKFYGCVFLLLLTGLINKPKIWITLWLASAIAFYFTRQPFFMGWFISPTYSFYFIGGVTAYGLYKNKNDRFSLAIFLISAGFALLVAFKQASGFVAGADDTVKLVAVLIVVLMYAFYWLLANGHLAVRPKAYWGLLGAMSYPIYLMHATGGRALIGYMTSHVGLLPALLLGALVVICAAVVVHMYIERPLFKIIKGDSGVFKTKQLFQAKGGGG